MFGADCLFVHLFAWFRTHRVLLPRPIRGRGRRKHACVCVCVLCVGGGVWRAAPLPPPLPPFSLPLPNQFRCVYLNCQRSFRRGGTDANGIRVPGDFNFHADSPDCTPAVDSFDCAGLLWSHLATLIYAHTHASRIAWHSPTHTLRERPCAYNISHLNTNHKFLSLVLIHTFF